MSLPEMVLEQVESNAAFNTVVTSSNLTSTPNPTSSASMTSAGLASKYGKKRKWEASSDEADSSIRMSLAMDPGTSASTGIPSPPSPPPPPTTSESSAAKRAQRAKRKARIRGYFRSPREVAYNELLEVCGILGVVLPQLRPNEHKTLKELQLEYIKNLITDQEEKLDLALADVDTLEVQIAVRDDLEDLLEGEQEKAEILENKLKAVEAENAALRNLVGVLIRARFTAH
ncbi:hypothetical protein PV04_02182 [Phialophora macrospora]|uniref:Uncharacterized protein n=1 Tax=Phialophora macrospora TaxID=1851006 RepID=A0A0D2GCM3_9EURO|nr:hypothetical protein PV04_02182 [Phialophora macrospora]